jgi:DNA mismatch repair protein MutS
MDQTLTAMGGRLLKQWMKQPLCNKESIEERLDGVEAFIKNSNATEELKSLLKQIPDIERLLSRLSVGLGNARDLVNLKSSIVSILEFKKTLSHFEPSLLQNQSDKISANLEYIVNLIEKSFVEEPPLSTKEGRMIRFGIHPELDLLRSKIAKSKNWITDLEKKEKERTGISSLKIRFNKVFGFYIEISNSYTHLAPAEYMRKQTLVNGERYITKELKVHEEIILSAEEMTNDLEYNLFSDILKSVISNTALIQDAAESIATTDCLVTFAGISEKNRYCRPTFLYSGEMRIKDGRHPVVEKILLDTPFVPNDTNLDNITQSVLLITGPNMAGKSVFIRQVALLVLMAQMGCYVPASSAHLSIVDRIFVRSGASDVITSGLSTFMVEMVETAYILNHATEKSLIIMDEIGRGTSTYDGISIAWAVAEYLATHFERTPKVLFATHYHELQSLEDQYSRRIKNFHMAVAEQQGVPIFLHTLLPGGASHSFGVAVAKLAGVPEKVIERAYEMLQTLEYRDVMEKGKTYKETVMSISADTHSDTQISTQDFLTQYMYKELQEIDIAIMTPLEALNKLAELKDKIKIASHTQQTLKELD